MLQHVCIYQGQFFQQILTGLNFPFPKLEDILRIKRLVYPTIYSKLGKIIVVLMPFPRVLALREMQTASSRIWMLLDV